MFQGNILQSEAGVVTKFFAVAVLLLVGVLIKLLIIIQSLLVEKPIVRQVAFQRLLEEFVMSQITVVILLVEVV